MVWSANGTFLQRVSKLTKPAIWKVLQVSTYTILKPVSVTCKRNKTQLPDILVCFCLDVLFSHPKAPTYFFLTPDERLSIESEAAPFSSISPLFPPSSLPPKTSGGGGEN